MKLPRSSFVSIEMEQDRTMKTLLMMAAILVNGGPAYAAGTKQEQDACSRDAVRFCRPLLNQGDISVLGCLQQNRIKLRSACKAVLQSHGV